MGGHQHTEAVCGLPSSSSSKNRGEKKQRWLERLNSCWNRKCRKREGQRWREVMGVLGAAWVKVLALGFSAHCLKDKSTIKCSNTVKKRTTSAKEWLPGNQLTAGQM